MKKCILCFFIITSMLLLSSCGNDTSPEDSKAVTANNSALETENKTSSNEDLSDVPVFNDSTSSDIDDYIAELNRQAEEQAATMKEITDGPLYDSIIAIYPDVRIDGDAMDSLYITIFLKHQSVEEDSFAFFDTLLSICQSCNLESDYSSISFSMMVDDKLITILTLGDYIGPNSFKTATPFFITDEYEEIITDIYSTLFSENDISNRFNEALDSLIK
ncbi:MAG: hypothetical protein NC548_33420 [Lachnospiraceae bacterium]|nr:hypothetical protein [Lachnospiraceae bacterium]MCM1235495.1 hypothetical protein [Ruminococcus flavefaciens]